jgi:hypothetical protein
VQAREDRRTRLGASRGAGLGRELARFAFDRIERPDPGDQFGGLGGAGLERVEYVTTQMGLMPSSA